MSPRQAFASALHLFVVLAFFLAGFFFVSFPYFPQLKVQIFETSTLIGLGLFAIALILLVGFYALDRGRYLVIRMGVSADLGILRQTVEDLFAREFSSRIALADIEIGARSRLEIGISLTPLNEEVREELFIQAERHLGTLLRERFGYEKPFRLIVKL